LIANGSSVIFWLKPVIITVVKSLFIQLLGFHIVHYLVSAMLVIVAIIHLLPVVGVLGVDRLETLYGVAVDEPNLAILMRHRAVLFGLVGGLIMVAAFSPKYQPFAFVAGFVSVLSFFALVWSVRDRNEQIQRVLVVDIIAVVCLVIGSLAYAFTLYRAE
jgi:hypothetical protein